MSDSTPPAADPTADPTPLSGQQDPEPERTFTQADLERIVGERLARERGKYGDYDDLKQKAAKFDELEAQSKSELDRAREAAQAAEQKAQATSAAANARLIRAEVIAAAVKAGAIDTDAVVALLPKDAVTVDDDGIVHGAEEAVKALLTEKTFLVKAAEPASSGSPPNSSRTGNTGQLTREQLTTMSPEEIDAARREGKLAHLLSGKP